MTHDEKVNLVYSITDPITCEAEFLQQLYHSVVADKLTMVQIIDKLEESSHRIAEVQNKIEAVTKIKA